MNRPLTRRTQGILLIILGIAATAGGLLVELLDHHLDTFETYRTPALILIGAIAIVVGILRLRGRAAH